MATELDYAAIVNGLDGARRAGWARAYAAERELERLRGGVRAPAHPTAPVADEHELEWLCTIMAEYLSLYVVTVAVLGGPPEGEYFAELTPEVARLLAIAVESGGSYGLDHLALDILDELGLTRAAGRGRIELAAPELARRFERENE